MSHQPLTRIQVGLMGLVLLAGGVALTLIRLSYQKPGPTPESVRVPRPQTIPWPRTLGSEEAAVAIYAYLPLEQECVRDLVDYLLWLGETYPKHVFIGLEALADPALGTPAEPTSPIQYRGRLLSAWVDEREKGRGLFCAYLRINGRVSFHLPGQKGRKPRQVVLTGPVHDALSVFSVADFQAVLEQVLVEKYGALPGPIAVPRATYQGRVADLTRKGKAP